LLCEIALRRDILISGKLAMLALLLSGGAESSASWR